LKRVVVIDGNKRDLKLISFKLKKKDIDVFEFTSGLEGINWLRNNKADGCLVNLQLPIMSGIEILNDIHLDERHTNTKVICISDKQNFEEQPILEYGFDGYIPKPINSKLFVDEIKKILDYTIV
jgi:DNA-binding response OmpR family regulator